MEIRWANIVALGMIIAAVVLICEYGISMAAFLATIKNIGPGHSVEEQTIGLAAFGLCGVLIVAVVRIVIQAEQNRKNK